MRSKSVLYISSAGSENNSLYIYYKGLSKQLLTFKFDTVRSVLVSFVFCIHVRKTFLTYFVSMVFFFFFPLVSFVCKTYL